MGTEDIRRNEGSSIRQIFRCAYRRAVNQNPPGTAATQNTKFNQKLLHMFYYTLSYI